MPWKRPAMAWQPKHWTAQQLEERQLATGRLRQGCLTQAEVARPLVAPHGRVPARLYARLQEGSFDTQGVIQALLYFRWKVGRPPHHRVGRPQPAP